MSNATCGLLKDTRICLPWNTSSILSSVNLDTWIIRQQDWAAFQCRNKSKLRYETSFYCYSGVTDFGTSCKKPQIPTSICPASCYAFVKSVEEAFKDPQSCSQSVNDTVTKKRDTALTNWKSKCRSAISDGACLVGIRSEQYQCGFGSLQQAISYCQGKDTKTDNCCKAPDIANGIMEGIISTSTLAPSASSSPTQAVSSFSASLATNTPLSFPTSSTASPTPSIKSTTSETLTNSKSDFCSNLGIPCSAFIASMVGVGLLILLTVIVFVTMKRHRKRARKEVGINSSQDFDDRDLNLAKLGDDEKYPVPLNNLDRKESNLDIMERPPVVSATKLTKNAPSPLTFLLDEDDEDGESDSPKTKGRLAPSARGWVKEGYSIYECTRPLIGEGANQLRLRLGDQLIIKEMYSNGLALGLNLFTGEEGILPLHAIAPLSTASGNSESFTEADEPLTEESEKQRNHKRTNAITTSSFGDEHPQAQFGVYDDSELGNLDTLERGLGTESSSLATFPYDEADTAMAYVSSNRLRRYDEARLSG